MTATGTIVTARTIQNKPLGLTINDSMIATGTIVTARVVCTEKARVGAPRDELDYVGIRCDAAEQSSNGWHMALGCPVTQRSRVRSAHRQSTPPREAKRTAGECDITYGIRDFTDVGHTFFLRRRD